MLKVLEKSASAFPDVSVTSPVATTVIRASNGSVVVRKTVVLSAEREILELISVAPENSANVLLLTVDGCNGSEKVSVTTAAGPMPVAPSGGVTMTTVGGSVSAMAAVVNDELRLCSGFAAKSVAVPS